MLPSASSPKRATLSPPCARAGGSGFVSASSFEDALN
jgi:hypothetical protein